MDEVVIRLLESRRLAVPPEDREALDAHWARMRALRATVDESLLADNEIALTYDATRGDGA
jgi:hypothetical protein